MPVSPDPKSNGAPKKVRKDGDKKHPFNAKMKKRGRKRKNSPTFE